MNLPSIPETFVESRDALHRIAVHVVARAREQASGRFGLRATPGGFGTPALGGDAVRVRVADGVLVRETAGIDLASTAAMPIDGASLRRLAALAQVDLDADLDVGHDTPPMGDVDAPIHVDSSTARALGIWFEVVAIALDRVVAGSDPSRSPSAVQLWPEHFDVAVDLGYDDVDGHRVNLGGSPGDGFHAEPYVYVGPWTDARPGDQRFWNAPFGATLGYREITAFDDPVHGVVEFYRRGLGLLATG